MDKKKEQIESENMQNAQNQEKTGHEEVHSDKKTEQNIIEELEQQVKEKDEAFLRLYAEFDNFRKRTAKERIEQSKVAGKDIIIDFLPILDDFYRAKATIDSAENIEGVKEGLELILSKLWTTLTNKGLTVMDVVGDNFDSEIHDAVTEIPAPNNEMKGKIVDQVEKGYKLNDVIIRFPKVVVGK